MLRNLPKCLQPNNGKKTIHLSAFFGSKTHRHFEDIAKNGQKDFEDFAEPLSVRLLQDGKDNLPDGSEGDYSVDYS